MKNVVLIAIMGVVAAAVIARSDGGRQPQSPNGTPAADSAKLVAMGKSIFEGKAAGALCFTCHAANAKGVAGLGPNLTDASWLHGDGSLAFLQAIVKTGVVKPKQAPVGMPPMGGANLTDEQIRAVAMYVLSLRTVK